MSPDTAARVLGVAPPRLAGCTSRAQAERALEAWKADVVGAAWRREVQLCHPDRATGEADRQAREARCRKVNTARDVLRGVRLVPRPRRPATRVVIYSSVGAGTATTGTTTGGWRW